MSYRFFTIPVRDPGQAETDLNTFLGAHRIISVDKQFVANGENSCWSFCVEWVAHEGPLTKPAAAKNKIDYKDVLNEADFALFAHLRTLRKQVAEAEGVPPYVLFTNEQLAEIVRQRVVSKSALLEIRGVGKARVEKYGERFLALIEEYSTAAGRDEKGKD